jgi:hypothetical protein
MFTEGSLIARYEMGGDTQHHGRVYRSVVKADVTVDELVACQNEPPTPIELTRSEERLIRFCRRLAPIPGIVLDDPIPLIAEEAALILAVRRHLPVWNYDESGLPGSARVASTTAA